MIAKQIISEITKEDIKMGDIKKQAKAIKIDHDLALELWANGGFKPRMLAILIFDKKLLTQDYIENLAKDMLEHPSKERNYMGDWLLANQFMKSKAIVPLMLSWQRHELSPLRRLFWYYQARLRWTGQAPPDNSAELLDDLEREIVDEAPDVQWTMNFCAAWIGIYELKYRPRCIKLGKQFGLYKDEKVPKNCTPNYLPEFIRIEVEKRSK